MRRSIWAHRLESLNREAACRAGRSGCQASRARKRVGPLDGPRRSIVARAVIVEPVAGAGRGSWRGGWRSSRDRIGCRTAGWRAGPGAQRVIVSGGS